MTNNSETDTGAAKVDLREAKVPKRIREGKPPTSVEAKAKRKPPAKLPPITGRTSAKDPNVSNPPRRGKSKLPGSEEYAAQSAEPVKEGLGGEDLSCGLAAAKDSEEGGKPRTEFQPVPERSLESPLDRDQLIRTAKAEVLAAEKRAATANDQAAQLALSLTGLVDMVRRGVAGQEMQSALDTADRLCLGITSELPKYDIQAHLIIAGLKEIAADNNLLRCGRGARDRYVQMVSAAALMLGNVRRDTEKMRQEAGKVIVEMAQLRLTLTGANETEVKPDKAA